MRHQMFAFVIAVIGAATAFSQPPATTGPKDNHGFLGVMVAPGAENQRGVMIQDIAPSSPAAKAGLKSGDRIIKVGDQEPKDIQGFMKILGQYKPGDRVKLTINRGGKEQTVAAELGKRPTNTARRPEETTPPTRQGDNPIRRPGDNTARRPGENPSGGAHGPAFLGVTIEPLTPELRQQMKVDAKEGAVVVEVAPNSPAEKAGLKHGDVITGVGDHAIKTPDDLREAIRQAGAGKQITLNVSRGGEKKKLKATPQTGTVGYFGPQGDERFPGGGEMSSPFDQTRRIRELEQQISDLQKRVKDLERNRSK